MKILWVKAGKLLPVDTGGKIRTYHLLRQLAARHEVTLLSYYFGCPDPSYDAELARHFPGAIAHAIPSVRDLPGFRILNYLWRLPARAPYAVTKFTAPEVRRLLEKWMHARRFDVAVCDFLSASLNFPQKLAIPAVLFQHNVESVLWRRQADSKPNWLHRLAFKLEAGKMVRYESSVVRRFDYVIAVSEEDRRKMNQMTEASRIAVVPTGVDLQQYRPAAGDNTDFSLVVFLGSMDWEANIDGAEYFCREIWPSVRTKIPEARFRIVGRDPGPRVRKLASDSVEVTGTVPSVVEHLREAAVLVVPLRIGGGTRLKVYEAMAMGRAVVSTSVGAEGLDVMSGRDILLADDAATFADCVIRLLRDPALRECIGLAAAKLASQYDWSVVAEHFEAVLKRVARQAGGVSEAAIVGAPEGP
jgi:polysaccharide biosynthesis protein PslH